MNRVAPALHQLAGQLLTCETKPGESASGKTPAVILVCAKLQPVLAALMGPVGFRALLARALVLASVEAPWLGGVRVTASGELAGLDEAGAQLRATALAKGGVQLIAELLGLLAAFIGEDLTVRLVREAWPQATFNPGNSRNLSKA